MRDHLTPTGRIVIRDNMVDGDKSQLLEATRGELRDISFGRSYKCFTHTFYKAGYIIVDEVTVSPPEYQKVKTFVLRRDTLPSSLESDDHTDDCIAGTVSFRV